MFSKDILERAEKREQRSQEFKKRYESGDENALREFCRVDPFAIRTPWLQKAVEQCLLAGKLKPLTNLFTTGKREQKHPTTTKQQNLMIANAVQQKAQETGLPRNQPKKDSSTVDTVYDAVYLDQTLMFEAAQAMSPRTLLNHCMIAKNSEVEVMIEDVMGGKIVSCGPMRVSIQGKSHIGFYEFVFPHDGEPWHNAHGVFDNL